MHKQRQQLIWNIVTKLVALPPDKAEEAIQAIRDLVEAKEAKERKVA